MNLTAWLDPGPDVGLAALFVSSFLSATLLPGSSELVLIALLSHHPETATAAIAVATVGNTLGGMSTYLLARAMPARAALERLAWARRHGAPVLILSWAPLVGDGLCAAAGWLRLNWVACLAWMAVGKLLRYGVIAFPFM